MEGKSKRYISFFSVIIFVDANILVKSAELYNYIAISSLCRLPAVLLYKTIDCTALIEVNGIFFIIKAISLEFAVSITSYGAIKLLSYTFSVKSPSDVSGVDHKA
jgi:hypothetical protein